MFKPLWLAHEDYVPSNLQPRSALAANYADVLPNLLRSALFIYLFIYLFILQNSK